MTQTHMEALKEIYEAIDDTTNMVLFYCAADSRLFTPDEREGIQDSVFQFLDKKNVQYAQIAWGFILFIAPKECEETLKQSINDERFVIVGTRLTDNLDADVTMVDDKLHDEIERVID